MPKKPTDYTRTIIYKIEHNENKELVYVGSTINFTKRKCRHKANCNNVNDKKHNFKVYKMIRENGGWDSFQMLEVKKYPCNDSREARAEEERCRVELKATLNMKKAFVVEATQEYNKMLYEENLGSFKQAFEFTNSTDDFVLSKDIVEWNKEKGTTMTKLGRDLNTYAETNKFENVKSKAKKIEGKVCQCWIGIRSIRFVE